MAPYLVMKKPILIVEDDSEIRQSLVEILKDEGYLVYSAENGRKGLDVLGKCDPLPGLVILDIMMPVLDGFGFRESQLTDDRLSNVPTVLFSADGNLTEKASRAQVSEFLAKPVDLDILLSLARKYCD